MKKILILSIWLLSLSVMAQKTAKKTTDKYTTELTTLVKSSTEFINSNKLSSSQMKKMMQDTFRAIADDADFIQAINKYFSNQYDKDLIEILKPYYKDLTIQQIDSLITINSAGYVQSTKEALTKCNDAEYRDQKVDEMLNATVTAKNDKAKAKAIKKIKKNMSKFTSDCPDDYRQALVSYTNIAGQQNLSEDYINAIYHTISIDDLKSYTAAISSNAAIAENKVENGISNDIYNIQAACVSKFQSWTYKAYPSLFTKKQVQTKKRKGRKGKSTKNQQNDDTIIEGVEMY